MAEHFYNLLIGQSFTPESSLQLKVVDVLYEIGQELLQCQQNELATKWLCRAYSIMEQAIDSCTFPDIQELRLNLLHTYGRL